MILSPHFENPNLNIGLLKIRMEMKLIKGRQTMMQKQHTQVAIMYN
jgi:hypothetical protein